MSPEREAKIWAAFARHDAEGLPLAAITNKLIYDEIRGKKGDISVIGAAWRAQQRTAHATNGAVAVLEPPEATPAVAYAEGQGCCLVDGLPVTVPPAPRRDLPRLAALARERTEAQRALDEAQRRVQDVYRAQQEAQWAARLALDRLHQASRRARMAPAHEMAAGWQRVEEARAALAGFVGIEASRRAEGNHAYVPPGL